MNAIACRFRAPAGRAQPAAGFAFITAIFLLVVLGAFAAFVVGFSSNAQMSSAIAVQGARAYEAANAGLEWATYQILDPRQAINGTITTPPGCFTSPTTLTLPAAMGAFGLSLTCTRYPLATATPNYYEEGSQRVAVYVVTATATYGVVGSAGYVERQLEAHILQCKNPYAPGPAYACS